MINNSNEFLLEIMTFYGHWFSLIRQKLLQNDRIHFIFNWIATILGKNINIHFTLFWGDVTRDDLQGRF